ncbi:MAG: hypothetical protein FGM14_14050 [Flavobacteriales bacterium]|nr:hypothetical protein [Flavobacteriales bacterium]
MIEDLIKQFQKYPKSLQDEVNQILKTLTPQQQAQYNQWRVKIESILKLPADEQLQAFNKIKDEFKHYKP